MLPHSEINPSISQINSDKSLRISNPQPLNFRNVFQQQSSNINLSKPENESIFNDQNLFKNAKYETSNAISYKSKSNQTSHSSPFSNISSKSFINQNDPINLANKAAYIIERDPTNSNFFKSARAPRVDKSIKSDEPLEKLFENYSNRELSMSFPMFFSQFDMRNQGDQVIDSNKNREFAGFYDQSPKTQRLSSVYAKARNKMKIKNNGIITKNVIFFKKYMKKQEELQTTAGYSSLNNANNAKRLQLFVNDAAFYQEGLLEKHPKPQFSADKLIKSLFSLVILTFFNKIKAILGSISLKNLDFRKNYHSLSYITTVFIVFYAIILPLNLGFSVLPSHFLAIDIIMLALLAFRFYHKKTEKKFDYSSFFQIISVFSYIFAVNSVLSFLFVVFSFKELRGLWKQPRSPRLEIYLFIGFFHCILLANAMVCAWILVQNYYGSLESSWMSRHQMVFLEKDAKYLAIFNFVLSVPFNKDYNGLILEQLFGIVASFVWLALILSEILHISHVFYEIKQEKNKKDRFSKKLEDFLKKMQVIGSLKEEIMGFSFKALENQENKEEIEKSLGVLTTDLREKLIEKAYTHRFELVKVLVRNFSKEFIGHLLRKVKILQIKPKESLFEQGDKENQALYFVDEGEIELFIKNPKPVSIKVFQKNEIIGEVSFFSNYPQQFSAKSRGFTSLLMICKEDFLETLKNFPQDLEVYTMLKDKINIYKTSNFLQTKCVFCEENLHISSECPSLFPHPNKRMIIFHRIYMNSQRQRRKLYHRSTVRSFNSLKDLPKIQEHAWLILEKHAESISLLLDDIYPSSEYENYNEKDPVTTSNNDSSDSNAVLQNFDKSLTDSKDSKCELTSNINEKKQGGEEQNLMNPPSIFLQPSAKSKRKSTGSIFEERKDEEESLGNIPNEIQDASENSDEKEEEEEQMALPSTNKLFISEEEKKKSERTLNNEEISKQTLSDKTLLNTQDEKKIVKGSNSSSLPSEKFYSEKDSSINVNSMKNNSKVKSELIKYLSSERDSKFFTEKDTMHLLQNFDKLEKKALLDRLNSYSHKTSNTTHGSGENKRNLQSIFSYSKSTSYISSMNKLKKKRNNSTYSLTFRPTHNKKTNYSDYLKNTLFWYDFEKMAEYKSYFPHNNVENVVKVIRGNNILKVFGKFQFDIGEEKKFIENLKKSIQSNQANTSYSSKKTSQKSKVQQSVKSNEEENEEVIVENTGNT